MKDVFSVGLMQHALLDLVHRKPAYAYATALVVELNKTYGAYRSHAQISLALNRMVDRGLLTWRISATRINPGKPRKYYTLTSDGEELRTKFWKYIQVMKGPRND
jgi:DNA-binding PadR family transcriptional regulator